jgi:subtilisin family serine protease
LISACGTAEMGAEGDDPSVKIESNLANSSAKEQDILISVKPGSKLDLSVLARLGARHAARLDETGVMSARLPTALLKALAARGEVEYIETDRVVTQNADQEWVFKWPWPFPIPVPKPTPSPSPNPNPNPNPGPDPSPTPVPGGKNGITLAPATMYSTVGSLGEYTWGLQKVGAPALWDTNNDGTIDSGAAVGSGVKVCIIDSGIDPRHPELQIPLKGGIDYVDNDNDPSDKTGTKWGQGHGTHVAGTIAAQLGRGGVVRPGMDGVGVVGVAPGVSLYMVRALGIEGSGKTSNVIKGLEWCRKNGMHIVSLSLGSDTANKSERTSFNKAYEAGLLIVASAGNDGPDVPVGFPAGYEGVIAVGAINPDNSIADFSQQGDDMELVAPGVDVLSSVIQGSNIYSQVVVDGVTHASAAVSFAPKGNITGPVVPCGLGDSKTSCIERPVGGFVAYVDRGGIAFADKVKNVVAQGAKAVIIGNNDTAQPDDVGAFTLGAEGKWPPTASVSFNAGVAIKRYPGRAANVQLLGYDYDLFSGTSMAVPHVTGAAALVWGKRPNLTNAQLRELLGTSALDLGAPGKDKAYGHGLVQPKAALDRSLLP